MADQSHIPGTPDWWLRILATELSARQGRYDYLLDYDEGRHPVPNGDHRFVKALRDLQEKAQTNYVSLAHTAITSRLRVKGFRFGAEGQHDPDAQRIWDANNMQLQSTVAITDACRLGEVYGLVSPPDPETGQPVITIEDPRMCVVKPNPLHPYDPMKSLAGLKLYREFVTQRIVAVVYLPEEVYTYATRPVEAAHHYLGDDDFFERLASSVAQSGLELVSVAPNPLGSVPLIRGQWQPNGKAECENGAFRVQDRINWTTLSKLVIMKAQAYRQRMITGAPKRDGKSGAEHFEPGAEVVWMLTNPDAKLFDLEQADITQILESIRDDIGDFAALLQIPITHLTNKISNVSGDTFFAAQSGLVSKARLRMDSMGWFFEALIKTSFRYLGDSRATEVEAETVWYDAAIRTMSEAADAAPKYVAAGIPLEQVGDIIGLSPDEIRFAVQDRNRREAEQRAHELELKRSGSASNSPGGNSNGQGTD